MRKTWRKFISREGVDPLTISGLDEVFYACIRQVYKNREPFFTIVRNRVLTHYLNIDAYKVGKKIYPVFFRSSTQIKKYYKRGLRFLSEIKKTCRFWKKKYARDENRVWMPQAYKTFRAQFRRINYDFSIWPWWGIESWQEDFEEILHRLIQKRKLQVQQDRILESIYRPWKKTAILKLQEDLQQRKSTDLLIKKYQFLRSWSLVWFRPIDRKWINDFKRKIFDKAEQNFLNQKELIRLLKPNRKERKFIEMAPYIVFFKDWRDDVRRQHVYAWGFLFDAIAERFGVERADLGYLSLDELENMLKTDTTYEENLNRRKSGSCVITCVGNTIDMQALDSNIEKYLEIAKGAEQETKTLSTVKGIIAQTGKTSGIVRIIETYHDIKKFKVGEILIANTTHPNYIPAMQKAKAFVTNEGGIASHASIVAREMKKPCIVGTKIATKVFKDGDLVEVDADKGIIKKI